MGLSKLHRMDSYDMNLDHENQSHDVAHVCHEDTLRSEEIVKCNRCRAIFSSLNHLTQHKKFNKCKIALDSRLLRQPHSQKLTRKRVLCNNCGKGFRNKKCLLKHEALKRCSNVSFENREQNALPELGNVLDREELKFYEDEVCPVNPIVADQNCQNFVKHELVNKKKRIFKCQFCGITCLTRATFHRHKAMVCKYRYRMHKGALQTVKPFLCQICGTGFHYRRNLLKHERNSECNVVDTSEVCQKISSGQENLQISSAHKPMEKIENISVTQNLVSRSHLKRNIRHPKSCYECEICLGSFSTKCSFDSHFKVNCKRKSKLEAFVQSFVTCVKGTSTKNSVQCNDCGFHFRKQKYLNQHLKLKRCKALLNDNFQMFPPSENELVKNYNASQETESLDVGSINNDDCGEKFKKGIQNPSLSSNLEVGLKGLVKEEIEKVHKLDLINLNPKGDQDSEAILHDLKKGTRWNGSYILDQDHEIKVDWQDINDKEENSDFCKLNLEDDDGIEDFVKEREHDVHLNKMGFLCKQKKVERKKSRKCPQCGKIFVSVSNLNKHLRLNRCRNVSFASWQSLKKYPLRRTNKHSLRMKLTDECNTALYDLGNDADVLPSKKEKKVDEMRCTDTNTHSKTSILKDKEVSSSHPFSVCHMTGHIPQANSFSDVTESEDERKWRKECDLLHRIKPLHKNMSIGLPVEINESNEPDQMNGTTTKSCEVSEGFIKEEPLEVCQSEIEVTEPDRIGRIDSGAQTAVESGKTSSVLLGHTHSTLELEMAEIKKPKTCLNCGHSFVSSSNLKRHMRLNRCKNMFHDDGEDNSGRPMNNHYIKRKNSSQRSGNKCSVLSLSQVKKEDSLISAVNEECILSGRKENKTETLQNSMLVDCDTTKVPNILQNETSVGYKVHESDYKSNVVEVSMKKTSFVEGCEMASQSSEVVAITQNVDDDLSHELHSNTVRHNSNKFIDKPIYCNDCGRRFLKKKYLVQHKKLKRCKQASAESANFPLQQDIAVRDSPSEICNDALSNQSEVAILLEGLLEDKKRGLENSNLSEKASVADDVEGDMNLMAAKLAYFAALDLMHINSTSGHKYHNKSDKAKSMFRSFHADFCKEKKNGRSLPLRKRKSFTKREDPVNCNECGRQFLRRKYLIQHIRLNRCKTFIPEEHQTLPLRLDDEGKDYSSLPTSYHSVPSSINGLSKPIDIKEEHEQDRSVSEKDKNSQIDISLGKQVEEGILTPTYASKLSHLDNVEVSECNVPYFSSVPNKIAEVKEKNGRRSAHVHRVRKKSKPVHCGECGRDFSRKRDLNKHRKLELCKIDLLKDCQTSLANLLNVPEGHGVFHRSDDFPPNIKVSDDKLKIKNIFQFHEQEKPSYKQRKVADPLQEREGKKALSQELKRKSKTYLRSSFISKRKTKLTKEQNVYCNDCGRQFLRKRYLYVHKKLHRCKLGSLQGQTSPVKQEKQIDYESSERSFNVLSDPSYNVDGESSIVKLRLDNIYIHGDPLEYQVDSELDVKTEDSPEQRGVKRKNIFSLDQSKVEKDLSKKLTKTKAISQNEIDSQGHCPKTQPVLNDLGEEVVDQSSEMKDKYPEVHTVLRETVTTEVFDPGPLNTRQDELNGLPCLSQTSKTRYSCASLQDMYEIFSNIDSLSGEKKKLWRCLHCRKHFSYKSNAVKHCRLNICKKKEYKRELTSFIKQENDYEERISIDEKEFAVHKKCHESEIMASPSIRNKTTSVKPNLELKVESKEEYDCDVLHQDHAPCFFKILREAQERKSYACWVCEKEFGKLSNLNRHFQLNRCESMLPLHVLSCCICGRYFSTLTNLEKHLNLKRCKPTKKKYTPWQCPCGKYFSSTSNRNKHQKLKRCKTLPSEHTVSLDEQDSILKEGLGSSCSQIGFIKKEPLDHNEEYDVPNFELENEDFSSSNVVPEIIMKEQLSPSALECFDDNEHSHSKPMSETMCVTSSEEDGMDVFDHFLADKGEEESYKNSLITLRQETYCNSEMSRENRPIDIIKRAGHKLAEKPFKCHICHKGFKYNKNRIRHFRLKRCKGALNISDDSEGEESPKLDFCRKSSGSLKIKFFKRAKSLKKEMNS